MDNELRELESQLEKLSANKMPNDMVSRMVEAMDRWQETVPVEEKVVPFQQEEVGRGGGGFMFLATAAAVALMAAVGVMLVEAGDDKESVAAAESSPSGLTESAPLLEKPLPKNVVQVSDGSFDREIVDEPSRQIMYDGKGVPHRVVRMEFQEKTVLKGDDGREVTVEKPRVEYYVVPLEMR